MSNSSRIAKNTLALYFRQILIMLVSLYTVRVVLNTLGAEDYGIYNVVAGVVVLFSFVNNAMAASVQRFLNFYLGKNDTEKTRNVYSASLMIHGVICLIFVALAETAGLWLVNAKLNIPVERNSAAFWCYQAAVITTLANIMRVPYNAVIIAYEKMSFFAGLSIVEAVLKLVVVFLLKITPLDKLIFYSFLLAAVSFVILAVYKFYCNKNFEIAHYKKNQDRGLGKELVSFSGWSLFGAVANVANTQGTNIVLNIFTNVTVNAAMGIANQVNAAVYSFVSNFQTAFNPQLVKSYAAGEKEEFQRLVNRSAKFSFYLLWLIVLPVYANCDFLLSLWLKNVPQYSVGFVRLVLIFSLIESLNGPLWISIQATGKIRAYQIIIGMINILNLPLSVAAFCLGANPYWILYIRIALNCFAFAIRVLLSKKYFCLSVRLFLRDSVLAPIFIAAVSAFVTFLCGKLVSQTVPCFFATCVVSLFVSGILIFFAGMKALKETYSSKSSGEAGNEKADFSFNLFALQKIHFSVDDVISCFENLTINENRYDSAFDEPFLSYIKTLHEKYNARVSLYCFYEKEGFSLAECTEKFADEFKESSGWLKFGFHAEKSTKGNTFDGGGGGRDVCEPD